ncbi:MAG: metal-dependent hydrolase [Alphaproteobacteria bacterium]|jgi:inner membrane protein|nr:metal-dependent hydrolase [Alphaproteobacteria bacterium]MCB9984618.1 metal-dependent hydrolase [Micavibrio sp.]
MDSITQIALGAVIGQAIGHKKLGHKALIFGALGGFLPDLDVLITPIANMMGHHDEFMGWKYHRHFSHSLWFGPLLGSLMGWGLWTWYGKQAEHLLSWIAIMVLSIFTHSLLDTCTIYGTQLLAPFSNHRFYIPSVSIIDPIYTIPLFMALSFYWIRRLRSNAGRAALISLIFTTLYLGFGWGINFRAEHIAREQLAEKHIEYKKLNAYTTIFQPWLRRIVVYETDNLLRVGFVSTLSPQPIFWTCKRQSPQSTKDSVMQTQAGQLLNWFSIENLSISEQNGRISATDARYGIPGSSIFGWWGVDFDTLENGSLSYVGRSRFEREASWHSVRELFKASYGLENSFLPDKESGCS